ncbi:MAG: anthranilate synthase component II [Spirochaetota bacterium]
MICMIDNYDSFTYNVVNYVKKCGQEVDIYSNDHQFGSIPFEDYSGIILSPGPSSPDKSGITLDVLRTVSHKPVLGICLGMQAMGLVFGGRIVHARKTMHGKIDTVTHNGCRLFSGIPERFDAVRYHSLAVEKGSMPDALVVTALSSDGEVMAIRHCSLPVYGVQFHPESYLSEHGMKIIENFVGVSHEYKKPA